MAIPHPSLTADSDAQLEALRSELRAVMATLNELHHPVYAGSPVRIAELEARVKELQGAIAKRRAQLSKP